MSDSPDDFPQPRTWPAILWTIAGAAALLLSQVLGLLAFLGWQRLNHPHTPLLVQSLLKSGAAISIITFVSSLVLLLAFLGFTRVRTHAVRLYLGLRLPSLRDLGIWIAAMAAILVVTGFAASKFEDPRALDFMRGMFTSAQQDHLLWLLAITVTVIAPIGEEITFRGFLFKTIELRFGVIAAIVTTALGWAALHIQYGFASIASIFVIGLLLGAARHYSRSLILTMILHAIWNGMALASSFLMFSKL